MGALVSFLYGAAPSLLGYGLWVRFKVCHHQRLGGSDFLICAYISNTFIFYQLNVRRYQTLEIFEG